MGWMLKKVFLLLWMFEQFICKDSMSFGNHNNVHVVEVSIPLSNSIFFLNSIYKAINDGIFSTFLICFVSNCTNEIVNHFTFLLWNWILQKIQINSQKRFFCDHIAAKSIKFYEIMHYKTVYLFISLFMDLFPLIVGESGIHFGLNSWRND